MSNFGQVATTAVGAVIGFYLGGPAGAVRGAYWGYLAGQVISPTQLPTAHGPRLDDLKAQSSQVGQPIPLVFGTMMVAGNVIWASDLKETKHKDTQGGKGGPTQKQVSYTYSQSVAIGLCESPVAGTQAIQGIRRIWANGKLIYDRSAPSDPSVTNYVGTVPTDPTLKSLVQSFSRRLASSDKLDSIMTIYDGTQVAADPTIESFEGVGNVPAFKDLAYVVLHDLQLADYGNRLPNLQFEVYTLGTSRNFDSDHYSNQVLYPWLQASADPRNPLNDHAYTITPGGSTYSSFAASIAADATGYSYIYGYSLDWSTSNYRVETYDTAFLPAEHVNIYLRVNNASVPIDNTSAAFICTVAANYALNTHFWWSGNNGSGSWSPSGIYWRDVYAGTNLYNCGGGYGVDVNYDKNVQVQRVPRAPWNPILRPDAVVINANAVLINGVVYRAQNWVYTVGAWKVLQACTTGIVGSWTDVTKYPLNPARPSTSPDYSSSAFWTAAYNDAVTAGLMPAGKTYGVDYPVAQGFGYVNSYGSGYVDVFAVNTSDIVAALCKRAGLTAGQIDVSGISSTCDGYAVTSMMDGRSAITPVAMYGLFAGFEADGKIKFVERGAAAVATISTNELRASADSSSQPSAVDVSRKQDVELPQTIRVTYASPSRDYQPGEQQVQRLTTTAVNAVDVQIPVSMSDTKALQLAEIYMFDAWTARNSYGFALDWSRLSLTPTDVLSLPVDGNTERVRIVSLDSGAPGVIKVDAVRDDDGDLTSYATRATTVAVANSTPAEIVLPGPTDLVLLDLPALRSTDNDAGYYAAGRGYLPTWQGYAFMRSFDGGANYSTVATSTDAATMATLTAAFTSGSTSITVTADSGTFSAATGAQLDAGANLLAIGAAGRWELLQFGTATLSGGVWTLGGLRRGLRGTAAYESTNLVGDRAVLVSGAGILRIPLPASQLGIAHMVKPVSVGASIADTAAVSFTSYGLSLQGSGLTYNSSDVLVSDEIFRQVFGP